jgi:mannose-1-phosphate guanylyltransferase
MKAVILAGGLGERFWPLSTAKMPKQFLKLFGHESLLRQTFERLHFFIKAKDIYVVTSHSFIEDTYKELPELPIENIIGEPERKNTAPACYLGTILAKPDEIILTVPADHYIYTKEEFREIVEKAISLLNEKEALVTIGIKPTRPDTGYGYIESVKTEDFFKVIRFHEKPVYEKAVQYLASGTCFWNSGMFLWKKEVFLTEIERYAPDIHKILKDVDVKDSCALKEAYGKLPSISIDYALMEKSRNIVMIPATFFWSDMGNWESIRELEGYATNEANLVLHHSENVFVRVKTGKPVIVIGVRDLFIVDTENGLLVANKDHLQDLREALKTLKSNVIARPD